MAELNVKFHEKQLEVFNSTARFKVVAAGRRGGKTYLSMWTLILKGLASKNKDVLYVAPTLGMAKSIMWGELKNAAAPVTANVHESDMAITLVNGIKIHLKGADKPDSLRGVGYSYVVLDEYATMKPATWEMILRPTLADVKGDAMFIGTPEGKNHFFELWQDADDIDGWESFHFNSVDNPLIAEEEIEHARESMSTAAFKQEFEASFQTFSGGIFQEDWIITSEEEPTQGSYVIAVDPAGFEAVGRNASKAKLKLDETAIAVVKIHGDEWWVKDIYHGRWSVKETAARILNAALDVQATTVGIEKGSLKNAIIPYLEDEMRSKSRWVNVTTVTHGGKKKTERITWSLQGRLEHGKITLRKAEWNHEFISQLLDFPSVGVHDDMCFPAETPVITADGVKSIVDVTTNDKVLTRKGWKQVLRAWCKGTKPVITRYGITATPDHKIWTENRGWVSLDSLCDDDEVMDRDLATCKAIDFSRITEAERSAPVYDLMVEDQHEFFAWGVLVHNCDALAYIDQVSVADFASSIELDEYEYTDEYAGY